MNSSAVGIVQSCAQWDLELREKTDNESSTQGVRKLPGLLQRQVRLDEGVYRGHRVHNVQAVYREAFAVACQHVHAWRFRLAHDLGMRSTVSSALAEHDTAYDWDKDGN